MNNYFIDTMEFCSKAIDKTVYRPYNLEAFNNMIRFLKTADTGSYIVTAETPDVAISRVYNSALKAGKLGYVTYKEWDIYEEMLKKEAKRQSRKPETKAVVNLGFPSNYKFWDDYG